MGLSDEITKTQAEEEEFIKRQQDKYGDYTGIECPKCGRVRVVLGGDGKSRCEKCIWCIEDDDYDREFRKYL